MVISLEDFTVESNATVRAAMLKITANHYRVVVVLDGKKVVGTVSDGDVRRAFLKDVLPIAPVEQIMNINCETTTETDRERLKEIILSKQVTVLPVVNNENELIDIVVAYEPFATQDSVE